MARRPKKKQDKIRSLKSRARKRAASRLTPAPTGLASSGSPRDRDSAAPQEVRIDPVDQAKQDDRSPRFQLACKLWALGEFERAADFFHGVLEREIGDPCCARYWLASCMFQSGSSDELDSLLEQHDDGLGIWRFAQALHVFRQHGDTEDAQRMLIEADHLEPGFETYLLRDGVVDARREARFDAGPDERAFGCARLFLPAWRGTPGAAVWARRVLKVPPAGAEQGDVRRLFPRDELRSLPSRRETWQVGLIPCNDETRGDDPPMWLFGVANVDGQEIRVMTVIDQPLTETVAWNELIQSFLRPMDGDPARPEVLVVCRREFRAAWEPLLAEIGIRYRYEDDPQPVGQLLTAMGRIADQHDLPDAEDVDIREFPQSDAVWQADFIRSPAWVMNEQEGSYRPWSVLVLEKSRSNSLLTSLTPGDPTPEMLLEFLVRAMARPLGESAQRPRLVEVADSDCYDHLRPRLEAFDIGCRLVDELGEFNDFCLGLARSFDGSEKCALADGRGVERAQMESFYEAAEYFFRKAPWRRLAGEAPIEICCNDPAMGARYGVVLGRTGVQMGLCIYDDWETAQLALSGRAAGDEIRALVACYDEAEIMSAVDLQLIERLGWPIATPEAWPAVMRLWPGRSPCSASAEELRFLDACLRAIPDFLETKATSQIREVETGTGPVELQLAWEGH